MIVFRVEHEDFLNSWPSRGYVFKPGRWHRKGFPINYTSESPSLAMLEVLANNTFLPKNRHLIEIEISDKVIIDELAQEDLPVDWGESPYPKEGAELIESLVLNGSLCIKVPSIITPGGFNYLLYAGATDFEKIFKIKRIMDLPFDPRLK